MVKAIIWEKNWWMTQENMVDVSVMEKVEDTLAEGIILVVHAT